MAENNDSFQYNYVAKQQEEIKKIRQKYLPKEDASLEHLRSLDRSVTKPGAILSITVGILSTLLLGLGMSCTTVWQDTLFLPGIGIGILGLLGIAAAYPLYRNITRKRREKLAPEILRLTQELLK